MGLEQLSLGRFFYASFTPVTSSPLDESTGVHLYGKRLELEKKWP